MKLSTLEIKGFKSFGDKTVIRFDEGITGVVGPNGCGKSNIVDAIRWVLGEQKTKALRSDKMENVIFNGSKTRKAVQMAEVSLTFDNTRNILPTEYSQVSITRTFYRSGESEYKINGVGCRLKDINDLFADTGIGPDSYSVIELKMVDDILNDRENSRRAIFEEAAGISKFKQRKKQTLRKLEETEGDLTRLEDILFEIEKNLKQLEKQARQAEKYLQLKKEYKQLGLELIGKGILLRQEQQERVKKLIEQENDRRAAISTRRDSHEAESEKLKKELIDREKLLAGRQRTLNEHTEKIRKVESEKNLKNERVRFLKERSTSLEERLHYDLKLMGETEHTLQKLYPEKEEIQKQIKTSETDIRQAEESLEQQRGKISTLQAEIAILNATLKEKKDNYFIISRESDVLKARSEALERESVRSGDDVRQREADLIEYQQKAEKAEKEFARLNEFLTQKEAEEAQLKRAIEDISKRSESLTDEINTLHRRLDASRNEYNLTKSLVDNLEGFPEAVRFLKKNEESMKNAPLLSDIVTCPDEYKACIEIYLEPYLNYYVTSGEEEALKAVHLLSEAGKGRAYFFTADRIEKSVPKKKRSLPEAVPALDVIEYDEEYRPLVHYLFQNVYIVPDDFKDSPQGEEVFVSKNGRLVKRKTGISGGSSGLFEGKKIGRAKNIEKLKTLLDEQEIVLKHKTSELLKLKQEKETLEGAVLKNDVEKARREAEHTERELIRYRTNYEQLFTLTRSLSLKTEEASKEVGDIRTQLQHLLPKLQVVSEEVNRLESKLSEAGQSLATENEVFNQCTAEFSRRNIAFHQLESKLNALEREIDYRLRSLEEGKNNTDKHREELQRIAEETKALSKTSAGGDEELLKLYEEKETIEGGVREAEKEYYELRGHIDTTEKEIRELLRQRENTDTVLAELREQLNEVNLTVIAFKERAAAEFGANPEELSVNEPSSLSEEVLKERVQKLKERIEQTGPVNPMAAEAYEEMKQRHDFMNEQKQDLLKAKASLNETISETEQAAKTAFEEAFGRIRENFIRVFRSLFSEEDTCDLLLSSPDNPLESAVDIIAKPKGKRPLTINQLSGGEKTLTAVSLLFAVYLLKPAPFCIFDEVDAPLDDANIDKFNNIIREFSKESQFIIVTHNKRTMENTDVIYGITMGEEGVSTVVPVDLRVAVN